jgi:hypothetical protein
MLKDKIITISSGILILLIFIFTCYSCTSEVLQARKEKLSPTIKKEEVQIIEKEEEDGQFVYEYEED